MAVTKASASITVALERDISATWRFYRITSSISPPSQPTEAQGKAYVNNQTVPSGWSTSEPAYDGTSTNSLYTCDLTAFTDGNVSWSAVSISSSYEAAKQAYNEAQNAKQTATNYVSELDNGVFVHASGTPSDPTNVNAKGVRITDVIEIIRLGLAAIKIGETITIGSDQNKLIIGDEKIDFHIGDSLTAYISQDKLFTPNAEVEDAFYIGQYSLRTGSDGKFIIGKRR